MPVKRSPARCLRLAILNDSPHVLKLLCDWFRRHGHHCATQMVAEMPQAHVEVEQFISEHGPDVVVYDVPMPYGSSWDLLDVIRSMPSLRSLPFVITTRNKRKLEQVVGRTSVVEIAGQPEDLRRLLKAVEAAGTSAPAK
jgi:CheY-like chemotaxis protein